MTDCILLYAFRADFCLLHPSIAVSWYTIAVLPLPWLVLSGTSDSEFLHVEHPRVSHSCFSQGLSASACLPVVRFLLYRLGMQAEDKEYKHVCTVGPHYNEAAGTIRHCKCFWRKELCTGRSKNLRWKTTDERPPPSYKTTFSVIRMYVQWNPFIVKQLGPLDITSASEENNFCTGKSKTTMESLMKDHSDERPPPSYKTTFSVIRIKNVWSCTALSTSWLGVKHQLTYLLYCLKLWKGPEVVLYCLKLWKGPVVVLYCLKLWKGPVVVLFCLKLWKGPVVVLYCLKLWKGPEVVLYCRKLWKGPEVVLYCLKLWNGLETVLP